MDIIDSYSKRLNKHWEVINRTDKGIQIRRIKRVNKLGLWFGFLLMPFWGFGLILWLLVLLDYLLQREKIMFITTGQMVEQLK